MIVAQRRQMNPTLPGNSCLPTGSIAKSLLSVARFPSSGGDPAAISSSVVEPKHQVGNPLCRSVPNDFLRPSAHARSPIEVARPLANGQCGGFQFCAFFVRDGGR